MDITINKIRTFDAKIGRHHSHKCIRLADGTAATESFQQHDGPDYLGNCAVKSPRPLTAEEWQFIDNGGELSFFGGNVWRNNVRVMDGV